MKILIVDQTGGGFGQNALYRLLAASGGLDVTLLVPGHSFDGFTTTAIHTGEPGSLNVETGTRLLANRSHRTILPRLWSLLRRSRFDILYAEAEPESYQALHAVVGGRLFSRSTKLVLMSWRNIDFPRGAYPFRAAWSHAWCERTALPRIDGLVAHNAAAQQIFRARGVPEVAMIPPAVDLALFRPDASAKERRGKFTIGYVGRFVPGKGIDILLRASARLKFDHELLLVGRGPDEGRLRRECEERGIAKRVTWAGPVHYESLPELYNAMDVLVLPSRTTPLWKEQFGRALIEAMACGVPVVGSDSGEIPTTIGGEGLVFAEGDAGSLASQLAKLNDDPSLRGELAERGAKRVADNFSTAVVTSLYPAFFKKVLGH
jgi:glycosyltransferase involved in cell wall biosynthesis